jgi:hypothetical protein
LLEAALAADAPLAARPVLDWLKGSRLEDEQIQTLASQFMETAK